MSQPEQSAAPAILAPDPLAVAHSATGGAVRDPLREMLVNAAELSRQTAGQPTSPIQTETEPNTEIASGDSGPTRETPDQVQRANGETVTTVL